MKRLVEILCRRRGSLRSDLCLRGLAVLALIAVYAALRWPAVTPFLGFFLVTLFVNGPLGPLLPAAYEPMLILMGHLYPPLLVATVGITGVIAVDWLDYYLYRAVLAHPSLGGMRRSWVMRQAVRLFERAPFFAVLVCALGILPHVAVRVLAPLGRYPVGRYLLATFLGRGPRLWFFAALGSMVPVSSRYLAMVSVVMFTLPLGILAYRLLSRRSTQAHLAPYLPTAVASGA